MMRAAAVLLLLAGCAQPERPVTLEPSAVSDVWFQEIVQCSQQPWLSWCRAECRRAAANSKPQPGWCS
jgi:hypothetical protein